MGDVRMGWKTVCALAALAIQIIGAVPCPNNPNCVCGGSLAVELNCNIDGNQVEINYLPDTYINIKCVNVTNLDYSKLPKCANHTFNSVSFKDCPLPKTSFKEVLTNIGVSKTMSLIFQNAKNLSSYLDRKHFSGMQNLTKLLLSVNGISHLPDNLFMDINKLSWLNIRSNGIHLSEELLKPLERLETLEISHNHMANISSNLFAHLSFLRKLSLWQSNVTWFSQDFFTGVDVLEELDLSSNGLNELPPSIFKPLKKLKKLTLFSNKFSSLPQNLFKNNYELETVIILNNDVDLKELPKNFLGNLPNLKQIYIQKCGLEDIPYDVFANSAQITEISLSNNNITQLPESIFNDQINLLELDLSYNGLEYLEPKIFSSLVRLEKLDLSYNDLVEISGSTFSPLLSLLDINLEYNLLTTIKSDLFSNNRQRLSVSLAHNLLNFEVKAENVSKGEYPVRRRSPFQHTYNLKLLNISYNKFKHPFEDWWTNGHEAVDFRHNCISYFWESKKPLEEFDYINKFKKPMKEVWMSENPSECCCANNRFLNFLTKIMRTKVHDIERLYCPYRVIGPCEDKLFLVRVIGFSVFFLTAALVVTVMLTRHLNYHRKLEIANYKAANPISKNNISLEFSAEDEEFVMKEVLPAMRQHLKTQIRLNVLEREFDDFVEPPYINLSATRVVIFSRNYLTSAYGQVNIKKIRGEMLREKHTIYVFADIGPENSIYTFLKEERDPKSTILWSGQEFWNTFLNILATRQRKVKIGRIHKIVEYAKKKLAKKNSFLPSDLLKPNGLGDPPDMQV